MEITPRWSYMMLATFMRVELIFQNIVSKWNNFREWPNIFLDTSVNVLRNSYNNLWRLLKRTLWFVNAFKCLHEYFTIHPFKMLIMNAHLKSSANLFFLSHLLNILKITKFINRNIEYIWLNCTITWETISVFNIVYIHVQCEMVDLSISVRLNTRIGCTWI